MVRGKIQVRMRSEITPSGVAVVVVEGPLDMTSAPALRAELHDLVNGGGKQVVVDLSGVDSIDSAALGALVSGLKTARKNGGDLRIAAPNERVTALLKLTKLSDVLRPADSPDNGFS